MSFSKVIQRHTGIFLAPHYARNLYLLLQKHRENPKHARRVLAWYMNHFRSMRPHNYAKCLSDLAGISDWNKLAACPNFKLPEYQCGKAWLKKRLRVEYRGIDRSEWPNRPKKYEEVCFWSLEKDQDGYIGVDTMYVLCDDLLHAVGLLHQYSNNRCISASIKVIELESGALLLERSTDFSLSEIMFFGLQVDRGYNAFGYGSHKGDTGLYFRPITTTDLWVHLEVVRTCLSKTMLRLKKSLVRNSELIELKGIEELNLIGVKQSKKDFALNADDLLALNGWKDRGESYSINIDEFMLGDPLL